MTSSAPACFAMLRLGFGGDRAEDARAEHAGPSAPSASPRRPRPHAPGRCRRISAESGMRQVVRRHALQHGRRRRLEIDAVGDLHQLRGGHHRVFGVGTARHGIGHAVAGRHFGDAGATASTVPAASIPASTGRSALYKPVRKYTSMKLTPLAAIFTSACPGPAAAAAYPPAPSFPDRRFL